MWSIFQQKVGRSCTANSGHSFSTSKSRTATFREDSSRKYSKQFSHNNTTDTTDVNSQNATDCRDEIPEPVNVQGTDKQNTNTHCHCSNLRRDIEDLRNHLFRLEYSMKEDIKLILGLLRSRQQMNKYEGLTSSLVNGDMNSNVPLLSDTDTNDTCV